MSAQQPYIEDPVLEAVEALRTEIRLWRPGAPLFPRPVFLGEPGDPGPFCPGFLSFTSASLGTDPRATLNFEMKVVTPNRLRITPVSFHGARGTSLDLKLFADG